MLTEWLRREKFAVLSNRRKALIGLAEAAEVHLAAVKSSKNALNRAVAPWVLWQTNKCKLCKMNGK